MKWQKARCSEETKSRSAPQALPILPGPCQMDRKMARAAGVGLEETDYHRDSQVSELCSVAAA